MGVMMSVFDANWPPKPTWSVDEIPDMTGKVVIVTGGNSGIGKETVKELLKKKAKVYIASHNESRVESAIQELKAETGQEALFIKLNLADLKSIKAAAEEFKSKENVLHVLINNAGVMNPPKERMTVDGYDLQWGINVIGVYYFTKLLIPELSAAPGGSRVVNVTSAGHILTDGIKFDTFTEGPARKKLSTFDLYNQSKFAVVVYTSEFARRFSGKGITATSLHPGLLVTNLGRDMSKFANRMLPLLAYPASKGAITSLYAATAPQTANANGKYLTAWAREGKPNPKTQDPELGQKLWTWLEEHTKEV